MTIIQPPENTTFHTQDFWVFWLLYFEGNRPQLKQSSVGKYKVVNGIEEGVETEVQAIEILRMNYPELN